jgi:hypothetical protein
VSAPSSEYRSQAAPRVAPETAAGDRSRASVIRTVQRTAGNRVTVALLRRGAPPGVPTAKRVLARRRVPTGAELERILFDPGGAGPVDATDAAAHRAGLERLIAMSRAEMSNQERARVDHERQKG